MKQTISSSRKVKIRSTRIVKILLVLSCLISMICLCAVSASAAKDGGISINVGGSGDTTNTADSLKILLLLTVLSVAPSIILMMTSFTRIVIVFSFLKSGLGLQQTPPTQVLAALALFLTLFIMSPVTTRITNEAFIPFSKGEISQDEALENAMEPVREFMLKQTKGDEINTFLSLRGMDAPDTLDEIPNDVLIPAFVVGELERAFIMGFLILIPFLIIDLVVASNLMSLGMIMLPPTMISLPFKVILFIVIDGWDLVIKTLVSSFK